MKKLRRYRLLGTFLAANAAFAALFVTLLLCAFHSPTPHDLPIGVVAPPPAVQQVRRALDAHVPGGFDLTSYATEAQAATAIRHRDIEAALVLRSHSPTLLTAGAAGAVLTEALTSTFTTVAAHSGQQLTVVDVVPPESGDTQALSPFFVILGVLFPSLAAGAGSALLLGRAHRVWAVLAPAAAAVLIGLVAVAVADGLTSIGNYAVVAGIAALFSLAVSAPTAAFGRIKPPLVAVGVLIFMVFGLPVSGGPSGLASFGYGFLREFDDVLPLGAAATTVRNTVYFNGNGITTHLWVLGAWAAGGLAALAALVTIGQRIPFLGTAAAGVTADDEELAEVAPIEAAVFDPAFDPIVARRETAYQPAKEVIMSSTTAPAPIEMVVGFDNSEPARRALAWSVDLLSSRPGSLVVVYVDHAIIEEALSEGGHTQLVQAKDHAAVEAGAAVAEVAAPTGVTWSFEHRQGEPADAILGGAAELSGVAAATGAQTVIVVGRSAGTGHHTAGSVPVRLLQRSPYPVVVIP